MQKYLEMKEVMPNVYPYFFMKWFLLLRMLVADLENSKLHVKYRKRHTIDLACRNSQILVLTYTFTPAHQVAEIPGCLINWNFLASTYPADSASYPHCRCEHLALHLHRVKCTLSQATGQDDTLLHDLTRRQQHDYRNTNFWSNLDFAIKSSQAQCKYKGNKRF